MKHFSLWRWTRLKIFILYGALYSRVVSRKFKQSIFFYPTVRSVIGAKYFTIGKKCLFGYKAIITAHESYGSQKFNPRVEIGDNCDFGDYIHISVIGLLKIGNNCLSGRNVTISDNNHGDTNFADLSLPPKKRKLVCKGPIVIEDDVWICDKVSILGGVHIGKGCVIGANSVVTKSFPPYCIIAGVPAKIIKTIDSN